MGTGEEELANGPGYKIIMPVLLGVSLMRLLICALLLALDMVSGTSPPTPLSLGVPGQQPPLPAASCAPDSSQAYNLRVQEHIGPRLVQRAETA